MLAETGIVEDVETMFRGVVELSSVEKAATEYRDACSHFESIRIRTYVCLTRELVSQIADWAAVLYILLRLRVHYTEIRIHLCSKVNLLFPTPRNCRN